MAKKNVNISGKDLEERVLAEITREVEKFQPKARLLNVGKILKVNDGVASIIGLSEAMVGELLEFPCQITGVVLNLKKDEVGAIILGDFSKLKENDDVYSTGKILNIKVSPNLLGRVINVTGESVDGEGKITVSGDSKEMLIEKIASGVVDRESVDTPLLTGIKAIDTMIPIGRGQRELIIGDRNTGKTAIAIDTIINQTNENKKKEARKVISIYVSIGQKQSKTAQVVEKLKLVGAMDETIVVVANAADSVAEQYIAPYAGCAIAEYFMEQGKDVLIIYDDLTKHAWAYRQISLILRRPSGREAFPGDIFYLHSRLLERSCRLNKKKGGGSITALPIIETQDQDISAFIPTNVISITDGQIYLEPDLFFQGIRPAVNAGLSVSRVGGAAQLKAIKQVSGKLRLDLAQYNELAAFAQFGSDLDSISKNKINRGERIIELLKQPQYQPVGAEETFLEMWFITNGYLDNVPVDKCSVKSLNFVEEVLKKYPKIKNIIESNSKVGEEAEEKLKNIAKELSEEEL